MSNKGMGSIERRSSTRSSKGAAAMVEQCKEEQGSEQQGLTREQWNKGQLCLAGEPFQNM